MKKTLSLYFAVLMLGLLLYSGAGAQTTTFNYQGSLKNGGTPANGNYDFEFALFNSLAGGTQLGATLTRAGIPVSDGVFSVQLDFGGQFSGANRFLEIRVRPSGGGAFTVLSPRQSVDSSPYSIRSLSADTAANATNATQLGGVAANQYVLTADSRLSDARPPTAGSTNYIQNQNAGPQTSSNFNIAGNGTVGGTISGNVVNAATQVNIGGLTMLSGSGAFVDIDFGINATFSNTFAGERAGVNTTPDPSTTSSIGKSNTFIGADAGRSNTTGQMNSFVGLRAGAQNTIGSSNSFYGGVAGSQNTQGSDNAFFGRLAGFRNTTGSSNAFVGSNTGTGNTGGNNNAFFGRSAGDTNSTGSNNTLIGSNSDTGSNNLNFATAVGAGAVVTTSNTVVLGRNFDAVQVPGNLGIGTTAPTQRLDIGVNGGNIIFGGANCTVGSVAIGLNGAFGNCLNYSIRGNGLDVLINRPTGGEVLFRENNGSTQVRIRPGGALAIAVLGTAGATALCRNASNEISTCSSSIRYKSNVSQFSSGLGLIRKLRPVSFDWLNGLPDLGLVAEEVAAVEPLLTTTNEKGQVEGVKYDRVGVVLVNAVKEQQAQIEAQSLLISRQQRQIDVLTKLVCATNPSPEICMTQVGKIDER